MQLDPIQHDEVVRILQMKNQSWSVEDYKTLKRDLAHFTFFSDLN